MCKNISDNVNHTLLDTWFCIKLAKVNLLINWKYSTENCVRVCKKCKFSFCTEYLIAGGSLSIPLKERVSLFVWFNISSRS